MKKIFALLFAFVASFGLLTSCEFGQKKPTQPETPTAPAISQELQNAKNYIKNVYQGTEGKVTANMVRPAEVKGGDKTFTVTWSVEVTSGDANAVSVAKAEDGKTWNVNVKYDNTITAEVKFVLTATISSAEESTTYAFNYTIPAFEANTIAQMISEADKEKIYFLEGVITAVNKVDGKTAFIITDATGSIFCYDGLEVKLGQKVQITGNYSAYNDAFHQLAAPTLVKVLAENQDLATVCGTPLVTTAEAINAAAKAEGATAVSLTEAYGGKYLEVTGYVVASGDYANLAVAADVASCCNLYANESLNLKSFIGAKVVVKGYARGVSVGNGITIQIQSVELAPGATMPEPLPTPEGPKEVSLKEALEAADGTEVIVKGRVKEINTEWSEQFGNITVTITDGKNDLYIYRTKTNVKVNEYVTITGKVGSYNGAKQIAAGSTAVVEGTYVEKTLAEAVALEDGAYVIVKGTVKSVDTAWSDQYGNITVTITDGTNDLYIYRMVTKVNVGDELTIYGLVGSYKGAKQIAAGSYAEVKAAEGGNDDQPTEEVPAVTATISFEDKANRTVFTTEQQVWVQNGITVTNDKGASTSPVADYGNPARFYKSSDLKIEYTSNVTTIVVNCNTAGYATALAASTITGGTAVANGKVVTITLTTPATNVVITGLSAQVRVDSLSVVAA